MVKIYLAMIRPVIEFGDVIYDCGSFSSSQDIENIQRQAAVICTRGYRHTSYSSLLEELNWERLSSRRKANKLVLFYKIVNNTYPNYLYSFLRHNHLITHNLRNRNLLLPRPTRLTLTFNSFFPSTTRDWNRLPLHVHNSTSAMTFKRLVRNIINPDFTPIQNPYKSLDFRKAGTWLSRIRMGLSALNHHRFNYHFILSPVCTLCNTGPETTYHYFFTCPTHSIARNLYIDRLQQEMELDTMNKDLLLETILYGRYLNPRNYSKLMELTHQFFMQSNRFI